MLEEIMMEKNAFIAIMCISHLLTAGEIAFRFHLGFVEKNTGRVVMTPQVAKERPVFLLSGCKLHQRFFIVILNDSIGFR